MSRLMVVLLAVACGGGKPPEMNPTPRVFEADALAGGPALIARARVDGAQVTVTVVGRELGPVLGYAFRLEGAPVTLRHEEALGPNAFGETLYFSSGAKVGAARQGAAAGEKAIDAETVLARGTFELGAGPVTLRLTDTSVRRADGSGVTVALAGGKIGGAP